jgi:putative transcriptional regulator
MEKIEGILEEGGYDYCEYRGCFDIAARKKKMMLIKVLSNVDSFQKTDASSLKVMSKHLEANSMVVGMTTRREKLSDNIVYERFDVPTVTPGTLEKIIINDAFPVIYRLRGGLFVGIDPKLLRSAREEAGLSQKELADSVDITKKNVYEHEKKNIKMDYEKAKKIEKILETKIIVPAAPERFDTSVLPKAGFEMKIYRKFKSSGFEADSVQKSPINMIARESRFIVLSEAEQSIDKIKKKVPSIRDFSRVSGKDACVITKEKIDLEIPSASEKEFMQMSGREIKKLARK